MALDAALLISKLNPTCLATLDRAATRCKARTNPSVELEHWLLELIDEPDADLARIIAHVDLDPTALRRDLVAAVDRLRTGNNRTPTLSPLIDAAIREAFVLAAVQYGEPLVRSGTLVLAILGDEHLARVAREISRPLGRVAVDPLVRDLLSIVAGSAESATLPQPPGESTPATVAASGGATPALDRFTVDLTAKAHAGEIDPILGRDGEIRQMADILIRRRQNNPILTGEAGVGKTAVVEGFALRVARGDVPPMLRDVAVRALDLGLLQAGAGVKGEFEDRLKGVIAEIKASPTPIILFIDEAHTMIGAGGQAGQGDAANLLKPALARGELRTIAATTWAEYKKYFEKDAALARRFQVIKVEEPTEPWAIAMMRAMVPLLEAHHGVRILDEAVDASVRLAARYITGRQLPDKSLGVLDTACARVALGRDSIPAEVEDSRRQVEVLDAEIAALRREGLVDLNLNAPGDRLTRLDTERDRAVADLATVETRWEAEAGVVAAVRDLRARIETAAAAEVEPLRVEHAAKLNDLRQVQAGAPLIHPSVDAQVIAAVVAAWTGVPVGRMQADEIHAILALRATLARRVLGQAEALDAICQRVEMARAGTTDPRRPVGVFLLVGPSGVGKTETAHALAEALFGGEQSLIVINMSEYQEAHTVSGLKGSPPGYVGYGEGGVLTEAVRRKPYSVVLLDEVEKAHPDVLELFYQVFDKGTLDDAEGREVNFKSTVILLTSNVASDLMTRLHTDPETAPRGEALAEAIRPELLKVFKPAFLARLAVVPYAPIADDVLREIARLQLAIIGRRLLENHGATFTHDEAVVERIIDRCTEVASGARNVDHILTRTLLPALSTRFLERMAQGLPIAAAHVGVDAQGGFVYEVS